MKKALIGLFLGFILISNISFAKDKCDCSGKEIAQRGCCSWHNGVCGCSGGSVLCCDGTYSPTCSCKKDDYKKQEIKEKVLFGESSNGKKL